MPKYLKPPSAECKQTKPFGWFMDVYDTSDMSDENDKDHIMPSIREPYEDHASLHESRYASPERWAGLEDPFGLQNNDFCPLMTAFEMFEIFSDHEEEFPEHSPLLQPNPTSTQPKPSYVPVVLVTSVVGEINFSCW